MKSAWLKILHPEHGSLQPVEKRGGLRMSRACFAWTLKVAFINHFELMIDQCA